VIVVCIPIRSTLERGGDVVFDAPAEIVGPAVLYLRV
jgi:hypothetical protein